MKSTLSTTPPQALPSSPKHWKPHAYQKRGILFGLAHAFAMFLARPGAGKTTIILAIRKLLRQAKNGGKKVLVIAPKRVCELTWPDEIVKWEDFKDVRLCYLHGDDKEALLEKDADIYLLNLEGLPWLTNAQITKLGKGRVRVQIDKERVKGMGFDMLVIDELSKMRNTSTSRFGIMKELIPFFGRRYGLTGSPAPKSLENLFGEAYVIDQGATFGRYITHFRNRFMYKGYDGYTWMLMPGAEKEIYKLIKPLAFVLNPGEYKGLPTLADNPIKVSLPPEVRTIYRQMEKELLAKVESEEIVAANCGVAAGKCRQIASGGVYLTPDVKELIKAPKSAREWFNLHWAKIDALEDLVDELQGSPLLVAYDFQHDLDRIRQRFGKDVPFIGGGVSAKRAEELKKKWNANELPLLFAHPKSVAHGLNLQEGNCENICWLTLTYDLDDYEQFIMRVQRQGNKAKRVTNHLIMASKTVDEDIYYALKSKDHTQTDLFEALKKRTRSQAD